jgi:hypothetical protein
MKKMVTILGLCCTAAIFLGGCELYFGHDEESWTYCDQEGLHSCVGEDCYLESRTCPTADPGGYSCASNEDCAAGCFCGPDGTCVEQGFCTSSDECPDGFHCDDRQSCVPDTCSADEACPTGQICDNGACLSTCECASDAEAQAAGYGYCDEATSTCYPGADPAGSCGGAVTCDQNGPNCPQGEVPLILDGCFTGECRAIAQCDATPACERLDNQTDCSARSADCAIVSTGVNCTKPDGSACQPGDTNCTCESFRFHSCEERTPTGGNLVQTGNGGYVTFESMFH